MLFSFRNSRRSWQGERESCFSIYSMPPSAPDSADTGLSVRFCNSATLHTFCSLYHFPDRRLCSPNSINANATSLGLSVSSIAIFFLNVMGLSCEIWYNYTFPCSHPSVLSSRYRRGGRQSGRSVKLTTRLQLVPRSRKRGSTHPLPHTPSWRTA
jgi:hypothetical protein